MHFKRTVDQGAGKMDPRLRKYHIYECAICKKEKEIDNRPNLNLSLLIKCPNCGITNDTDNEERLIKEKQRLEQQISLLTDALFVVSEELKALQGANHEILLPEPTNTCSP
jgi:DNA-directed RNA polymerase subunit RPC12/RpoP